MEKNMCNVFAVAKKLCETRNWQVSNLTLQKMLYIAQVIYLGTNGSHLFKAEFEAWDYGPVVPEVYRRFKIFGDKYIQKWAFPNIERNCTEKEDRFISSIAYILSELKPYQLVNLTHRQGTAWEKKYIPGAKNIIIPEDLMKAEYKDVWEGNQSTC